MTHCDSGERLRGWGVRWQGVGGNKGKGEVLGRQGWAAGFEVLKAARHRKNESKTEGERKKDDVDF